MLKKKKGTVDKAIKKFGQNIDILRVSTNDFGESIDETVIATVKGFYYKASNHLNISIQEKGDVKRNRHERLMISIDSESEKIQEQDTFYLNKIKYQIADLTETYELYIDATLRRIK